MSFYLVSGAGGTALASDGALIRAADRKMFEEATALVAEAARLREAMAAEVAAARSEARAEALAEARGEARSALAGLVADMLDAHAAAEAARDRDVARLALAAVEQMLAGLDRATLTAALARRVAADAPDAIVRVAPSMADAVRAAMGDGSAAVEADPALGPLEVRLTGADREVVADAAVQLGRLAQRWGLTEAGPDAGGGTDR